MGWIMGNLINFHIVMHNYLVAIGQTTVLGRLIVWLGMSLYLNSNILAEVARISAYQMVEWWLILVIIIFIMRLGLQYLGKQIRVDELIRVGLDIMREGKPVRDRHFHQEVGAEFFMKSVQKFSIIGFVASLSLLIAPIGKSGLSLALISFHFVEAGVFVFFVGATVDRLLVAQRYWRKQAEKRAKID